MSQQVPLAITPNNAKHPRVRLIICASEKIVIT